MSVPAVLCADIGSVASGRFGWWSSEQPKGGCKPSGLAEHAAALLNGGRPVALGFECPLYVPLADSEEDLTKARSVDGNRAWSAGAGCGALATGLVEVTWVLRSIKDQLSNSLNLQAFLNWDTFAAERAGLFLWEAFVSGASKPAEAGHIADARAAGETMERLLAGGEKPSFPNGDQGAVLSLIGAALLRSGWSTDIKLLEHLCVVIKAQSGDALEHAKPVRN